MCPWSQWSHLNVKLSNYNVALIPTFGSFYRLYNYRASAHSIISRSGWSNGVCLVTTITFYLFTSQSSFPAKSSIVNTSSIPAPINYLQGQSHARRPYLQPWKQLEVNNEAWLLCFMGHGEIASMIKISVRWKTMALPFLTGLLVKYRLALVLRFAGCYLD